MEDEVKLRIKQYLASKGLSVNKIAKDTGYPQTNLHKQINDSTMLSVKTLCVILQYCPDLSAEWILRGAGPVESVESGNTINIYRQGGNGAGQANTAVTGSNNQMSDAEAMRMILQQNQQLIDALIQKDKS